MQLDFVRTRDGKVKVTAVASARELVTFRRVVAGVLALDSAPAGPAPAIDRADVLALIPAVTIDDRPDPWREIA